MIKSFFWAKKWALWAWGGLLALLIAVTAQVHITVLINDWYGRFYDLFQNGGEVATFYKYIIEFCWMAGPYIAIAAATNWFARVYTLRWREAMTFSYVPPWKQTEDYIEGASQRIQEDCAKWADYMQNLGLQVVRAVLTLIAFIPMLHALGEKVQLPLLEAAIIASVGGMVVSWVVGYWLPGLEYNNQVTEAAFRKELVLGEDDRQGFCDMGTLVYLFTGLKLNHQRLYLHYGYFDLWVYLFDQFMSIAPYLVLGPQVVQGIISLGIMVQVSNAFGKVQGSLSLFLYQWTTITAARSVWKRLHEFQRSINEARDTTV